MNQVLREYLDLKGAEARVIYRELVTIEIVRMFGTDSNPTIFAGLTPFLGETDIMGVMG